MKTIAYMYVETNGTGYTVGKMTSTVSSPEIFSKIKKNGICADEYGVFYDPNSKESEKKAIDELYNITIFAFEQRMKKMLEEKEKIMNVIKEKQNKMDDD